MDKRRAQDLLRHIVQDEDYGIAMLDKMTVAESMFVLANLLPECIQRANDERNDNDIAFFVEAVKQYRHHVTAKLKSADHLWVVYSSLTGYPYYVDKKMVVLYDYGKHQELEDRLNNAGYKVALGIVDPKVFQAEVQHMYRNGYESILFTDGGDLVYTIDREELYGYDEFFSEDYITNPGLQAAMIDFFQEIRKDAPADRREDMLKRREDKMFQAMLASEFMVPCIKEENEEQIEISYPYIDLTDVVEEKQEGEQIMAVPVFTDGYEMDKCYNGHRENMLYQYGELLALVKELDASGIVLNYMGESYYMSKSVMEAVAQRM